MKPGGRSRPVGQRPAASPCPNCGKLLAFKWTCDTNGVYAWRHRRHADQEGNPCGGAFLKAPKVPEYMDEALRPPFNTLTITVHAIQMVQKRVRISAPHKCVEWIERVYPSAKWAFYQEEPAVRSDRVRRNRQKRGLRARHKPTRVDVFRAPYEGKNWRFYVRGKVLLTIDYEGMDSEDRIIPEKSVKYGRR